MFTTLVLNRNHHHVGNSEVELPVMTTELPIEREANLRAQKKKILQLQRLKYSSGTLAITDDSAALLGRDKHDLYAKEKKPNLSGNRLTLTKEDTVWSEIAAERSSSSLKHLDNNYSEVNKVEHRETPGYDLRNRALVSSRREGQFAEEITENYEVGTEKKGTEISIIIDNAEPKQYTPTFASASSEYHRKTTEIKKKADERRINVISPTIRLSSALEMRSNNEDYLHVHNFKARRSTSLNDLNFHYDDFDSKRKNTSHRNENGFLDSSWPLVFGDRSSKTRTSSWSSINESFPAREKELNFQGFARKQQEILEDSLRRVEHNLNTTFSRLKRYVNTEPAMRSKESSEQT